MNADRTNTSLDHFETVARRTVETLPHAFRAVALDVALRVTDWPDAEMLRDLGMTDRLDLTGLYEGVPVTEKSVFDQPLGPDMVWLFRQPILAEWRQRGDVELDDLIAHVTIHEFAHHFGWSDADIARIDRWWE
ncbi:metallopeptidase family protein [Sedimentitalea sp. JM2-8]|uniref:Metallopeptidase family protein n=1 Tax=Sedimentitalea xiamensis TaxID=3050037 RepID=A0ABT7FAR4_9RHOB|nr:metallopeptidase family protein [Sedimentitalea xiamensis]MDK3072196.1 metallopeptidase family protein [Sedimentitalea xiamensis]